MQVTVLQRTAITRYAGEFSSLSAFLLCPAPRVSDREESAVEGKGSLLLSEDGFSLRYKEKESGASFSLEKKDGILTVTRAGALLKFKEKERTDFLYRTAYGSFPTEAYTERITLAEREGAYLLTLIYTATFSGIAQRNELRFKITAR